MKIWTINLKSFEINLLKSKGRAFNSMNYKLEKFWNPEIYGQLIKEVPNEL